ncbi:MAG: PhzF family phenazine biosynthesis protein [Planctomycetes bacterium]|nr:PhzF family phenazine biosynthesis protein [Planctomycetota bacterium]
MTTASAAQPIYIVDAFTAEPFRGNAAAVCPLTAPADETWMQQVAGEMNLSETAFPVLRGERFALRWFTPMVEVDLCGHATLATAHVLWEQKLVPAGKPIEFETRSGLLTCTPHGQSIQLDFPATPATPIAPLPVLNAALGAAPLSLGSNGFDLIAEFGSEADVLALTPDYGRLGQIPVRGVIATAPSSDPQYDFVSRFFAPSVGVNEDPVCGSSHCCSGPFWAARLGKTELRAHQVSTRGGIIGIRVTQNRVYLSGQAVTVVRGTLTS